MTKSTRSLLEVGLVLVAVLAGTMFLSEVRAEGAACANDTCLQVKQMMDCGSPGFGLYYGFPDCGICAQAAGRCDGGTAAKCTPSELPQTYRGADVTKTCDCGQGATASTKVQAKLPKNLLTERDGGGVNFCAKRS